MIRPSIALLAVSLCGSLPVMAHVPSLEESDSSPSQPYQITTSLEKSIAIYAGLGGGDDVDVFQFSVTEEDLADQSNRIHTGTLTPRCAAYRMFMPRLFLIGPAQGVIPAPSDALRRLIAMPIPKHDGAIEVPLQALGNRDESSFYEEHSGTWYWWEHRLDLSVDQPGVYWLVVQGNRDDLGDYVLEFGDEELWTDADWRRASALLPFLRQHLEIRDESCRAEVGA